MSDRDLGFYWIVLKSDPFKWIIAEWNGDVFFVTGSCDPVMFSQVYLIKGRVKAPDALIPAPFRAPPPARMPAGMAKALEKLEAVLAA